MAASLLIADDQPDILDALRLLVKPEGMEVDAADSPRGVLAAVRRRPYDLVLMDLNYARDFVQKPWDNARVLATLRTQIELGRVTRRAALLDAQRDQDLELAAKVQAQLLPGATLTLQTLDCAARYVPAREVGGDYYDLLPMPDGHLVMAVGDVAGKGIAAALVMANLQALVRSRAAADGGDPVAMVTHVNEWLCRVTVSYLYATFFYGVYDERTATLTYVNAGHNSPVCVRADSTVDRLSGGGTVVGIFPDACFTAPSVQLDPGDVLAIFTDGVTEAVNGSDEQFGDARLVASVAAAPGVPAASLVEQVMADQARFLGESRQLNDMTLVIARRR